MKFNTPRVSHSRTSRTFSSRMIFIAIPAFALLMIATTSAFMAAPFTGAIFTTDIGCTGVNLNIFANKDAVYLDGGPGHAGAAGLPDGEYFVKVTEPNGTLLGTSAGTADETPVVVVGGEFAVCYQLSAILIKASDASPGYDTTSNPGGEYKVWISPGAQSPQQKTDNFKVKGPNVPPQAVLRVEKFYDANANGLDDDAQSIVGWQVHIEDNIDYFRDTPVTIFVDPDDYTVTELNTIEQNWIHTTTNPVLLTLAADDDKTVQFGNVCLGGGGGHTLGFWSNKNGQAAMNDGGTQAPELTFLSSLNLRNANGSNFDPGTYASFRTWILSATATNMSYMLSAQLAAMELNVEGVLVDGSDLLYAPALLAYNPAGINALGFISVNDLMSAANAELGLHGSVLSGNSFRPYQEALKNALDAANNNQNFVQGSPCPFSFTEQ
jgi:hypothetical protein